MKDMSLTSAAELVDQLRDGPRPVLLDVSWSLPDGPLRDKYLKGHIPGAVFVDFDAEICGPPGSAGRHPLPDPQLLQQVLRAAGLHDDSPVVVYDGGDMLAAARTWWTLRWAGLRDVTVLEGGLTAWAAQGSPLSTEVPEVGFGTMTVRPGRLAVLDADQAGQLARDGVLIDVRSADRFAGEPNRLDPVPGHIPGAVNLPTMETMNGDNAGFVPVEQLREQFARYDNPGVYCGSGVTAARTALAMTVAGRSIPPLYIGSWSNWISDPDRPVATGAA